MNRRSFLAGLGAAPVAAVGMALPQANAEPAKQLRARIPISALNRDGVFELYGDGTLRIRTAVYDPRPL